MIIEGQLVTGFPGNLGNQMPFGQVVTMKTAFLGNELPKAAVFRKIILIFVRANTLLNDSL